jgi:hypothetical protein
MSIEVIRYYSPGTSSDGETYDWTKSTTYDFGKSEPRNLIKAVRFSQETTGYEGYGAPVYKHEILVDGHELNRADYQANAFEEALEDTARTRRNMGVTVTAMAKEILTAHQSKI